MIEIFILSLIQGVTEFIPISSSSHLILISDFLNFNNNNLSIDVSLHMGSFLAVTFYFKKDIFEFIENKKIFFKILIASIPVMFVGFILVRFNLIDQLRNIKIIGWTTLIFGFLLFYSDQYKNIKKINLNLNYKSAIFIGILQIFSLIPGVSRSGIGITAARLLKFDRVSSAKISFLLSIPILGAVSIFGFSNIIFSESHSFTKINLLAVFLSFIFALLTIKYFLKFLNKFSLNLFVYYRIILGVSLLVLTYL